MTIVRRRLYTPLFIKGIDNFQITDMQGVPRNMTVGKQFRMSSSIICEVVILPKTIMKIFYTSHFIVKFFSK